jgi:murein L,D-transpeptidase YafK
LSRLVWALVLLAMASSAPATIPVSARSRQAAEATAPRLQTELAARGLQLGAPVFIRIFKQEKVLEVWLRKGPRYALFKSYPICTWSGELGPKLKTGDGQSPEGFYFVPPGRLNPWSQFHLSFDLGYPNAYDRAHGRTGGYLMVHGNCVSIGCYAMTDPFIEEIYTLVEAALRDGQPYFRVHVFPFRMTEANLERHQESEWFEFWQNLKEGHDWFERTGTPPDVKVQSRKYVFGPSD